MGNEAPTGEPFVGGTVRRRAVEADLPALGEALARVRGGRGLASVTVVEGSSGLVAAYRLESGAVCDEIDWLLLTWKSQ